MIFTSTFGTIVSEWTIDSTQLIKSDSVVVCMIVLVDANEGGHVWYSCIKNPSISLSLDWHEMYILEKSCTSVFRQATLDVDLSAVLLELLLNNCKLFFRMVLLKSVVLALTRSLTNLWYWAMPTSLAVLIVFTTHSPIITLVSSVYRSVLISEKGFPMSRITSVTLWTWDKSFFWTLGICSWWISWLFASAEYFLFYSF